MGKAHPGRPESANLLEVQGRVHSIGLEQVKVSPGNPLDGIREPVEVSSELRRCAVHLKVFKNALGLGFEGLRHEKIELSRLGISFDLLVPFLPVQFAEPFPQLNIVGFGKGQNRPLDFSDC